MNYTETFLLKPEHLLLLKNAVIRWEDCEYGAPAIDCKRPYGNSGVKADLVEILLGGDDSSANYDELRQLHLETETALQIVLQTQSFIPGLYKSENYHWKLIERLRILND